MNTSMFRKAALATAIAASLSMYGCGGGSGGSGGGNNDQPQAQQSVSGSAVKGVLKNAQVTAFELDSSGNRLTPNVGTARTDNAGEYTLTLGPNYQGGLIEIVVSADSATRMVCDATEDCNGVASGQEISSGLDGLTLASLAQPTPGQTNISAPVSAWTTLAANRAKSLAGDETLATAITKANRVVSEIVGYDISKVQAKGLSQLNANSSPEEAQSAALNAAVAEIIFGNGGNFVSALAGFSEELDDGKIELEGISNALDKVIAGSGNAIATNVLDSLAQRSQELKLINELNAEDIESSVTAPDAPLADKVQKFKTFLTQVRQLGDGLGAFGDSNALDTALGADEATLTAIFDADTVNTLLLSFNVIGQALNAVIDDPQNQTINLNDPADGTNIGSATITLDDEDNSFTLELIGMATGSTGQSFLPFDLSVTVPVALAVLTDDNTDLTSLGETATLQVDGTVGDQNTNVLIELTDLKATLTLEEALAGDNGAALDGETVLAAALDGELSGALNITATDNSDTYTFSGDILGRLVTFDDDARIFDKELPVSLEEISLSGEFSGSDNDSFAASASLKVRNARQFDVFGWLDLSSQSVTEGGFFDELPSTIKATIENLANGRDYSGDIFFDSDSIFFNDIRLIDSNNNVQFVSAAFGDAELQEALGLVNDAFEQTYNLEGLELDVLHAEMGFNKGQGGGITAVADVEGLDNADSFLNATISLTTDINYAGFSGKAVATVSRNSLIGGNLNVNFIAQGVPNATAQNLRLQVSSTDLEGAGSADITFSSPAGFRLAATVTFDDDQEITALTGDAFVGDDDIGDIELRNGVPFIVYAENNGETNFESLF
ncbi:hypothetical protein [Marinobacter sp. NSM]|uniref:hypothetical protein n=1 Tax=Marinobacter sp. NSM TaxID=3458004 RepID=UPI004036D0FC